AVHNVALEAVHFHEVGAVDSIADIVGTAIGLTWLGIDALHCSPLPVGRGTTWSQHGTIPVPAPATLLMLEGLPIVPAPEASESVTPTGAGIARNAVRHGDVPPMVVEKIGMGAGTARLPDRANILRIIIGTAPDERSDLDEQLSELAANIDDMPAEHFGYLRDKLFDAGALDVWWLPITMKDGRPAATVGVLCAPKDVDAMHDAFFAHSSTLGVRRSDVTRRALPRALVQVDTEWGAITMKAGRYKDRVAVLAPEYREARALAERAGVSLKEVEHEAYRAAAEAGWQIGRAWPPTA